MNCSYSVSSTEVNLAGSICISSGDRAHSLLILRTGTGFGNSGFQNNL